VFYSLSLEQVDVAPREGGASEATPDPPPGMVLHVRGGSDPPPRMVLHVGEGVINPRVTFSQRMRLNGSEIGGGQTPPPAAACVAKILTVLIGFSGVARGVARGC
jgi:hypothetical protein